ncbi:MAG: crossover junction endodeoxyribonuclease RuvC [Nitrospirota bacterium]
MIILGIDPGLSSTGFGAIRCRMDIPALLTCGHLKTSSKDRVPNRLYQIHTDMEQLLQSLHPDLVAVENVFSLVRYPKAGMLLGSVLGIVYVSAFHHNIPMVEITPREVKNALAGYGGASKQQVRTRVKKLLNIGRLQSLHASDALAVALTAFYRGSFTEKA